MNSLLACVPQTILSRPSANLILMNDGADDDRKKKRAGSKFGSGQTQLYLDRLHYEAD